MDASNYTSGHGHKDITPQLRKPDEHKANKSLHYLLDWNAIPPTSVGAELAVERKLEQIHQFQGKLLRDKNTWKYLPQKLLLSKAASKPESQKPHQSQSRLT